MADNDRILEIVRQRVKIYFPELGDSVKVELGAPANRPYSRIYQARIVDEENRTYHIVIKFLPDAEARFKSMMSIWPSFRTQDLWKIPRPIDCLDGAVVMEAVSGKPLQDRVPWFASSRSINRAAADCENSGKWLRFYHDLGAAGECKLDIQKKWSEFEVSLTELRRIGIDSKQCGLLKHRIAFLAEKLADESRPVSHIHGEFTADNILVDGNRIIALDLAGHLKEAIDHDLASFLNSILLVRLTKALSSRTVKLLGASFLNGYFGNGSHVGAGTLFLQGTGLCDVMLEIMTRRPSLFFRRWINRQFAGVVEVIRNGYGVRDGRSCLPTV